MSQLKAPVPGDNLHFPIELTLNRPNERHSRTSRKRPQSRTG